MLRPAFLALGLLLLSPAALDQATATMPTELQTLQAVLVEIRQLRQDLQTAATAARRAQILIYRLHLQQAEVVRVSQRVDEAKAGLQQLRAQRQYAEFQIKQYEEVKDRADNAADRNRFDDSISQLRAQIEASVPEEQEAQAKEIQLEEQLRIDQARLDQLQEELDGLDKAVINAALPNSRASQ